MGEPSTDTLGVTSEELSGALGQEEQPSQLEQGIALCLSGGGYRAMLFHVGALIRLNEMHLLSKLKRVSSVSGGAITAAALGMVWDDLQWDDTYSRVNSSDFQNRFVNKIRHMASQSVDISSVGWGAFSPFSTISENVSKAYRKHLFGDKTLQDHPDERVADLDGNVPSAPRFVMCATNVKTGSLWRFAKKYMADYRVGLINAPKMRLADVVAASSAFPPFLSPMQFDLDEFTFEQGVPDDAHDLPKSLRNNAVLTDGGVYDNLGLEAVWKRYDTVLVSDGGRKMADDLSPDTDWARHSRRLLDLLMHQVSNLRRRQIIEAFKSDVDPHSGVYWGIQTNIADFNLTDALAAPYAKTTKIAAIETRLTELSDKDQERLINWGYAVCDAGVRKYQPDLAPDAPPPKFPYAETAL